MAKKRGRKTTKKARKTTVRKRKATTRKRKATTRKRRTKTTRKRKATTRKRRAKTTRKRKSTTRKRRAKTTRKRKSTTRKRKSTTRKRKAKTTKRKTVRRKTRRRRSSGSSGSELLNAEKKWSEKTLNAFEHKWAKAIANGKTLNDFVEGIARFTGLNKQTVRKSLPVKNYRAFQQHPQRSVRKAMASIRRASKDHKWSMNFKRAFSS